jgi:hypothetical protein
MTRTTVNALSHVSRAHAQLLSACRNLLGRRIAFGGVEQDIHAAIRELRAARRTIDVALQALTREATTESAVSGAEGVKAA